MAEPDYRALCDRLLHAIEEKDQKTQEYTLCQIRSGLDKRRSPSDEDLLRLLRDHPLRTSIVLAAKEMAEYHDDAGRGARQVSMLMNVINYTRLVLKEYGGHDS